MARECLVCGRPISVFAGKVQLADGPACLECWQKAGFDKSTNTMMSGTQYNGATVKEMIAVKERNHDLIQNFTPTKKLGMLLLDDNTRSFLVKKSKKDADLYFYDQLVDFQLLQDGESITGGGLGSAVAGGLLFGGVGAIVGGVTGGKKTRGVCNSLQIKITLRNSPRQTVYLPFITTATRVNSFAYKTSFQSAQDALSALQLAVEQVGHTTAETQAAPAVSGADEILKYKQLLDTGVITDEEFQAKKKQLLGL